MVPEKELPMKYLLIFLVFLPVFGCVHHAAAGPAAISGIQAPVGMVYDAEGALLVAEWEAGRISKFDREGTRTVVADAIRNPAGLAFDTNGILYAASYSDGCIYALEPGKAPRRIASGLSSPTGLIWDGKTLVVANRNAGEVVRISLDGGRDIVSHGHKTPVGIARLADGSLVVSCYGGSVDMVGANGSVRQLTTSLNTPGVGIIPDGEDAVLVVDYGGTTVRRVTRDGKTTTVADGLRSPVGLGRMPDGRVIVGTWHDNAAFVFSIQ